MRPAALALAFFLLAPLALAQEHGHAAGDGVVVALHDGPEDGRAVVGGLTHFGFALLDHDGAPLVHRNANFTVEQGGVTLFATEDAHEYDGLFSFDVTFTRPGPYRVVAQSEDMVLGVFEGVAVRAETLGRTQVVFEPDAPATTSNAVSGRLLVVDENGTLVPHSDVLAELRRAGDERLVQRFHGHIHEEPVAFTLSGGSGDHVLRVVGYEAFPTGRGGDWLPSVAEFPITFGALPVPGLPPLPMPPAGPLEQRMGSATQGDLALHATVDPQNQVGVGQAVRFAGVVVNATGGPVAHVDFAFTLRGPAGTVFASESLHEYDGVFEHVLVPDAPGVYEATLAADRGDGPMTVAWQVQVVPPAVPIAGAGLGIVTVDGLDALQAGAPAELTFRIAGPQGPVQHSEVDVTLYHEGEAPVYAFKLHTHASGETRATVVLPHGGDWTLRVDPLPTLPQAVAFQSPAGPGQPIAFGFTVADAAADLVDDVLPAGGDARSVPGVPAAVLLAALAALVAMLPRRE